MKHLRNYKSFIFKPKIGTFWLIQNNISDIIKQLKYISKYNLSYVDSINIDKLISRMEKYTIDCIGVFIYYSKYGFSFSIIEDVEQMIELYKNQIETNVYKYIGEMTIINNEVKFNTENKKFLDDTIKYNL